MKLTNPRRKYLRMAFARMMLLTLLKICPKNTSNKKVDLKINLFFLHTHKIQKNIGK
jgi:hypothetical protein